MPIFDIFGTVDNERQPRTIKGLHGGNFAIEIVRDLFRKTDWSERRFYYEALDRELKRIDANITSDQPVADPSAAYKDCIGDARFAHRHARIFFFMSHDFCELPYHWMVLVGHRLAVERGLPRGGFDALTAFACARLRCAPFEVERWREAVFAEQLRRRELRDIWDYQGIQFRRADLT